jgi:hypothetical protein
MGTSTLSLGLLLIAAAVLPGAAPRPGRLPAIVFVSRRPIGGEPGVVPGLGPDQRAAVTGGRLLVREPDGRLRELLSTGELYDVSDPSGSPDGRRVAFAGVAAPDSAWRIYVVDRDGSALRAVTRTDRRLDLDVFGAPGPRFERYDDLDPCWIGADEICFASTRYPLRSEYADLPATNLHLVREGAGGQWSIPVRITSERNGAEEPFFDAAADRIVFARWWFSRYRPSATGITTDHERSMSPDSVNFWQAISIPAHGGPGRLAAGDMRTRRGTMAYQPAPLRDGSIAGVFALNLGLSPRPGPLGVQRLARHGGRSLRLAGAAVPDSAPSAYSDALGLAAPGACSPVGLPDGRVLFSYAPGGRGDYGLYVVDRAARRPPEPVVDLRGTLELDAAPLVDRAHPARRRNRPEPTPLAVLPATLGDTLARRGTFTYRALDLFTPRGAAPARPPGARIRFYAAPLISAHDVRDTVLLLREVAVRPDGSVEETGLPADVPMFEQVVDSAGRVVRGPHGPAHVAGFNAGLPGGVSRCTGCHFGHSAREPRPTRPRR